MRKTTAQILAIARGLAAATLFASAPAHAQVADVDVRASGFYEPSKSSHLLVINPGVSVAARPTDSVKLQAAYEADIVSGATEAVKAGRLGGVDVVSAATSFHDTRHVASGGVTLTRESTELSVGYGYGTESDYRSQSITASAATTFLQKNTELRLSYGRGFDKVCTSHFTADDSPSVRVALDSSKGCFTHIATRDQRDVALDNFQVAWTQSWLPVLTTQLSLTAGLQHGFLGNPYRSVVITPTGERALENHPENRARASLSLQARWYARSIRTAFGIGGHIYRDTWDLLAHSFELQAERYLLPGLRVQLRGRYYRQTGALFYSDDYTGGEPVDGPRGQYWTGDRELSPLANYSLGGRLLLAEHATPDARLLHLLIGYSAMVGFDLLKTQLDNFTWGGVHPDDTLGFILTLALRGEF